MEQNDKIKHRYDRVAAVYDLFEQPMEIMALKKWRMELLKEMNGKILEVGVGTGKNIEFYPDQADITAIDFSSKMLLKAKDKATRWKKNVNLLEMDAQKMSFPDNTFDYVFTTCVFCSVPDPVQGLKEIKRVCKPGGMIILIEHVRSKKRLLGLLMDLFNPVVLKLYGANINRRTVQNVMIAGFTEFEVIDLTKDIVKRININNKK